MVTQKAEQIIIGSMLGDGKLIKGITQINACFGEGHSLKQKEYLLWKKEILEKEFGKIRIYINKKYNIIHITSKVNIYFTNLHKELYPSGKGYKTYTLDFLMKLKPLGLAVWIMDDGYYNINDNMLYIACHNINAEIIKQYFKQKYDIDVKLYQQKKSNGISINFSSKDTKKIIKIIKKNIHHSMKYKIEHNKLKLEKHIQERKNYKKINKIKIYNQHNIYMRQLRIKKLQKQYQKIYRKENLIKYKKLNKKYIVEHYDELALKRFIKYYERKLAKQISLDFTRGIV